MMWLNHVTKQCCANKHNDNIIPLSGQDLQVAAGKLPLSQIFYE